MKNLAYLRNYICDMDIRPPQPIKGLYKIPNFLSRDEYSRFLEGVKSVNLVKCDVPLDEGPLARYNCFLFGGFYTHPCVLEISDKIRRECTKLQLHTFEDTKRGLRRINKREVPEATQIVTNDFF